MVSTIWLISIVHCGAFCCNSTCTICHHEAATWYAPIPTGRTEAVGTGRHTHTSWVAISRHSSSFAAAGYNGCRNDATKTHRTVPYAFLTSLDKSCFAKCGCPCRPMDAANWAWGSLGDIGVNGGPSAILLPKFIPNNLWLWVWIIRVCLRKWYSHDWKEEKKLNFVRNSYFFSTKALYLMRII